MQLWPSSHLLSILTLDSNIVSNELLILARVFWYKLKSKSLIFIITWHKLVYHLYLKLGLGLRNWIFIPSPKSNNTELRRSDLGQEIQVFDGVWIFIYKSVREKNILNNSFDVTFIYSLAPSFIKRGKWELKRQHLLQLFLY